jgi:hypothetical protein
MARTPVAKKELERIALQEIRSFPGAEHVISVEIECEVDQPCDMSWRLHVTAKDEADFGRITYAARTTTERLKRRYNLAATS